MARIVRRHPALFSLAFLLLAIPILLRFIATTASAQGGGVASADLEVALIRAGLDPEALAAAGLSTNQTTAVVDAFAAAMAVEPTRLAEADQAYANARVTSDDLRQKIQSGKGSAEDVTAYQAAMADLAAAEQEREDALNDWFVDAVEGLSAGQISTLTTIAGNRHWDLDLEMLAYDRTEAEWVELREALTHERVAAKYGETCDPEVAAYLADCRSEAAVAAAKTSLDTNGTLVKAAFETALQ